MKLQPGRAALVLVGAIVAAVCLIADPAEARARKRSTHQWQGWQTSSPNHWHPVAFWQWRAGLLP